MHLFFPVFIYVFIHSFIYVFFFSNTAIFSPSFQKEFDKKYNPTWHCVVGRNFGSHVTHETKHFIYFYLGQVGEPQRARRWRWFGEVDFAKVDLTTVIPGSSEIVWNFCAEIHKKNHTRKAEFLYTFGRSIGILSRSLDPNVVRLDFWRDITYLLTNDEVLCWTNRFFGGVTRHCKVATSFFCGGLSVHEIGCTALQSQVATKKWPEQNVFQTSFLLHSFHASILPSLKLT